MVSVFQVIKDFFPSILALAQTFLHSAHPTVVSFGSCMYKQAFAAFDSYCQQVQCDGWQLFYLGLHFVLECMSWSFRGQGFRQLEAFGERSVPKTRPRRRWEIITARLVASWVQAQRLLWLSVLDQHSSYEQSKADIFLLMFHCGSYGVFFLRRLWLLWWLMCAVELRQNWTFLWMCSRIWWCCTRPCWCAMPPLWRYVHFWVYTRFRVPYTTLPQIQNGPLLLQNRGIGKTCTCNAFLPGERQWSEVKGICCQSVSCKIGLYDFFARGNWDRQFPLAGQCLNYRHGMVPTMEILSLFTWAISKLGKHLPPLWAAHSVYWKTDSTSASIWILRQNYL